jgi:glutamate-1-semialdehyde 2,1-aminomutase
MKERILEKSEAMWKDALRYIPWGTNLLSRHPLRFVNGVFPKFAARAKGCLLWDIDGNQYIDFVMGHGPFLLGYADDAVDNAVIDHIRNGTVYTFAHPLETIVSKMLVDTIPCAEMARFAKTGGEATAIAIRIARGYTRKDKIVFCGYHGWHDWYLSANLADPTALNFSLSPHISARGVPKALSGTSIPFEYNNIDSLQKALQANKDEVAAVIMEPCRGWLPEKGFLEKVRELTHEENVLLIFDEIVTGFRLSFGGAQEYYKVTPDIAVFGKAMANGYPQAAILGRRDFMECVTDMFVSSMFWGDTIGLIATKTCINEIKSRNTIENVWKKGAFYQKNINTIAQKYKVPFRLRGLPPVSYLEFSHENPNVARELKLLFMQEMVERGFIMGDLIYFCEAHTDSVIQDCLSSAEEVISILSEALKNGDLSKRLKNRGYMEGFRRMV